MKTDKLLKLIQQKKAMRSGGALPLPKAQTGIANPMMPGTTFATGAIKQSASPIDLATGAAFTKLPSWIALAARMMPMPSPAELSKSILSAQPEDRGWLTSMIPFWQAYTTNMIRETYEKARDMYENANKKQNGGLTKHQSRGQVAPFITSDPKQFAIRQQAYNDSLSLHDEAVKELRGHAADEIGNFIPYSNVKDVPTTGIFQDIYVNSFREQNKSKIFGDKKIKPVGFIPVTPKHNRRTDLLPIYHAAYKKPVQPIQLITEIMMPHGGKMKKDDFIKLYGEAAWLKATNQKQKGGLAKAQPGGKKASVYDALLNYKESPDEDKVEFFDISGLTSWDDAVKGYDSWTTSNRTYPTIPESMDMFSAVPLLGRAKKAYEGMKYVYKPWRPAVDKLYGLVDYIRETYEKSKEEKQIGGLAKAQVGEEKNENLERLLSEYKTIQSRINEGYDDSYVKKLKEVADKLVQDRFVLEESGVVPENILNWKNPQTGDGPAFCIGTSCYIANQAGDPFKFYSNTMAQDYARDNPESTRYLEQSEKYIEPGDILQFKLSSEQGKPYHAYTVLNIGDVDDKGYKPIKVVGSSGHGPVEYKDYYLGPDNKVYKSPQGSLMPTQLLKRKTTSKSSYNDAVNRRNELKKQIDAIDPRIFNPQKTVRYNTYLPTEYFPSDSAFFGGRLEDVSYDVPERPNVYVLGPGRDGFQEQIYLKDSKLPEILRMAADKKYDIMKQHNISGDEYDAIVSNMLGMYGAETKFGTDYWGKGVPEWPLLTKTLPVFSSVGPFQLGRNNFSKELKKKYSKDDLYDPIKGAQANIEFLAENIPLLRKRAYDKPDDPTYTEFITPDNYLEYIPYLQAAPGWLRGDKATKKSKKDVVRGEHDYKKLVDYYRSFFQSFPMNMQEVVITPEKRQGGKTQKVKITKRK